MIRFIRKRISAQIGAAILIVFAICLAILATNIFVIIRQGRAAVVVNTAGAQRMLVQKMTKLALYVGALQQFEAIEELKGVVETYEASLNKLWRGTDGWPPAPASMTPLFEENQKLWQEFKENLVAIAASDPGSEEFKGALKFVTSQSENLVGASHKIVTAFADLSKRRTQRSLILQGIFTVGALVIVVLVFYFVRRMIVRPLGRIMQVTEKLAEGNLKQEPVKIGNIDEIGSLAQSFNTMLGGLKTMVGQAGEIADGQFQSGLVEERLAGGMELAAAAEGIRGDLADAFNRMTVELRKLTVQAKLIANDDLYHPALDVRIPGELGDAFAQMTATLRRLATVAEKMAEGDMSIEVERRSGKAILSNAFGKVVEKTKELAVSATRVAEGDLTATIVIRSEKDVLANAFAKMLENLRGLLRSVKDSAVKTEQTATEITIVSEKALGSVKEHQARLEDISAAATELATGIQEVAGNSSHADARMKEIAELARRSKDVMTEGLHGLEATETAVREAVQDMTQLNQNCRRVGEIVKTIEGIAAQTNMLALNAAIEAARAGEAGSGFAVVADEVRKLAEKAASEAGNITSIIESIGEGANKTLAAVERTSKVTNETATLTVQAGKALDEILTSIAHTSKLSAEIRSATDQQAKAGDEVAGAVVQISQLSRESSAAFSQLAAESSKLLNGTEDLKSRIGQFKL